MSGRGRRFRDAGYAVPKPLVPVAGVPMIGRVLESFPADWPATFVLSQADADSGLPGLLARLRPGAQIRFIPPHDQGPGPAVEEGLRSIPDDAPVFVSYCDYGMGWDPAAFVRFAADTRCDACVLSYRGFHAHYLRGDMYAYSRLDRGRVVEVREKGCFTDDREREFASTGGYFFRTAALLREALAHQVALDLRHGGELFTSLTVEALLRLRPDADVRVFEVASISQWGTPRDLLDWEFWDRTWRAAAALAGRARGTGPHVAQVLMPMAGRGGRFAAVTTDPKPLIPIAGRPMFACALDALPGTDRLVLVALPDAADRARAVPGLPADTRVVTLPAPLDGPALSVRAALSELDPDREVVVAACDHAAVLDGAAWDAFRADPSCDAAVFTITGLPAATRTPRAWAYVVPEPGGGPFPRISSVSVKVPVSPDPRRDAVLTGSFWFRRAGLLAAGIEELIRRDARVGGELYVDSVVSCLPAVGAVARMVPLDGHVGWGDPEALAEALYWQEALGGTRIEPRRRLPGVGS
jgi:NDP-sugar pyrophosphorylase family protein